MSFLDTFFDLATGAILAVAVPWLEKQTRIAAVALQFIGVVLIVYSIFELGSIIERGNTYPGMLALLPTAASALLVAGGTRLMIGWARQRAGLLCVGGVCRFVPASNGVTLTISSRF